MDSIDSKSRVVVITGANKGIGFELAKRLLKNPNKPIVVITSRSESRGKTAMKELLNQNPSSKESLFYHVLDITNKDDYTPFVDWVKATFGKFDVLVNNAAILVDGDGFSSAYKATMSDALKTLGTNYTSTRDFTEFMIPLLASDGKIINVSSENGAYDWQGETLHKKLANPEFKPKEVEEVYDMFIDAVKKQNFDEVRITGSAYNVSKALMNAWTYHILKDSLKGDQQAFSVDPGWCRTDMGGPNAPLKVEEGPKTIEYLIDLPFKLNKEINGKYFRNKKVVELK